MAGYIGSKAVLLSTTAATVTGAADIGGDLTVDTNTLYVDATNNRVGIGTSSPSVSLHVQNAASTSEIIRIGSSTVTDDTGLYLRTTGTAKISWGSGGALAFYGGGAGTSERLRIDSSGNLLVGKTSGSLGTAGSAFYSYGLVESVRDGNKVMTLNRLTSDGGIIDFRKDGTTVGVIGVAAGDNLYIGSTAANHGGIYMNDTGVLPMSGGSLTDNTRDLGGASNRWDDVYATNGTIQTSDANEKQDIAELDEAEKRVAVAAKGLIHKYRWRDAVAEKGDEARIHVGIIAQDLQAAFAAEGLDAGRYAMFISSTWWEHEGQTYETAEEAPEGATERTRLGVRYPELLAFIIGAM